MVIYTPQRACGKTSSTVQSGHALAFDDARGRSHAEATVVCVRAAEAVSLSSMICICLHMSLSDLMAIQCRAQVINSVLMDGVRVGDGAHIQGSILCAGVRVEPHASLRDCQVPLKLAFLPSPLLFPPHSPSGINACARLQLCVCPSGLQCGWVALCSVRLAAGMGGDGCAHARIRALGYWCEGCYTSKTDKTGQRRHCAVYCSCTLRGRGGGGVHLRAESGPHCHRVVLSCSAAQTLYPKSCI